MGCTPYKRAQKNAPRFCKMRQGSIDYSLKENMAKNRHFENPGFVLHIDDRIIFEACSMSFHFQSILSSVLNLSSVYMSRRRAQR